MQRFLKIILAIVLIVFAGLVGRAEIQNAPVERDPVAGAVVAKVIDGTQPLDAVTLDRTVNTWSEIGLTFLDAVRLNMAVVITNDSIWSGWVTDSDLTPSNTIYMTVNETLLSPVCPNGISSYNVDYSGSFTPSVSAVVGTNNISLPYYGTNGQLKITLLPTVGIPGQITAVDIVDVKINGVENLEEAQLPKTVTRIELIEDQPTPDSAVKRIYVEKQIAETKTYVNSKIDSYDKDSTKVLRAAALELGEQYNAGYQWTVLGEISEEGQLVADDGKMWMGHNYYPLLELFSDSSRVFLSKHTEAVTETNATFEFWMYTNNVFSEPFFEWKAVLTRSDAWKHVVSVETNSYPNVDSNGFYYAKFSFDTTNVTGFARAMQQNGTSCFRLRTDCFEVLDMANGTTNGIAVSNGTLVVIQK